MIRWMTGLLWVILWNLWIGTASSTHICKRAKASLRNESCSMFVAWALIKGLDVEGEQWHPTFCFGLSYTLAGLTVHGLKFRFVQALHFRNENSVIASFVWWNVKTSLEFVTKSFQAGRSWTSNVVKFKRVSLLIVIYDFLASCSLWMLMALAWTRRKCFRFKDKPHLE